ncbi:gamma carbonic anhydrase family protein [Methanococcus voltae]|uniref:Gamma carbonic anhydrase family protein n=1 Tax=Methanococcus voltae (strain ATCC BAA-1334 / A3) TaxID=456320 RepID=D7DV78_METV3|nr:gamma carbonic anhydrase family protein [Methanococcus voltae]MCS3901919.1 carbonic anhydrase/acetyltransferase-like protein (isoleucine patch superfamily) [Methanococcus voltae]
MAKIAKNATIIGKVIFEEDVNIWYGAVIRADMNTITIKKNSNVQDNCVVHCSKDYPTTIGEGVSVGHCAVIHGCTIGNNVLVGMNATVLNGAKIGDNCIIGANALVPQNKEIPANSLVMGVPAKVIRELTDEEVFSIKKNAEQYFEISKEL